MAKKLILLILIIPIILMIVLFAVTKTVSNLIQVPVSSVEIIGEDNHIYLDLDKSETYSLEYAVYPTNAQNKDVTVSTEAIGETKLATFDFIQEENAFKVVPKTPGSAKVTITTIDGGFKDSIMIHVDTTQLQSIECTVADSDLTVGDKTYITTKYYPENPSNTIVNYTSNNPKVAKVNDSGEITALSRGEAIITITSEFDETIFDTVKVSVKNKDAMDIGITEIKTFGTSGNIPISIASDDAIDTNNISYKFFYSDGKEVPSTVINASINVSGSAISLDYVFVSDSFVGDVVAEITFSHGETVITKTCEISRLQEISLEFGVENFATVVGQTQFIPFYVIPDDVEFTATVISSNDNVNARINANGKLVVTANKAGVATITLTVTTNNEPQQTKTAECEIIIKPKVFTTEESALTYGIEGVLTIGKHEYSYENPTPILVDTYGTNNAFKLHYNVPKSADQASVIGAGFEENIIWHSSYPDAVKIDRDGKIQVVDENFEGIVEFYAEFAYGGVSVVTEKVTIRCVGNGVNVYSYRDLYYATSGEQIVVLHNDIKDDFGYIDGEVMYTEIHTTYDDTYYKNMGILDQAKVKILISFKNDVYGNGHIINADNITYKLIENKDGTKTQDPNALFQGPLNFVMATHGEGANRSTISVKAQDNICFALYDNVTVTNVELRGCDLRATSGGSDDAPKYDLVDLNYTGTTVEVLGDNVNIYYSRLTNGRTVLRAFGDIDDANKAINVSISNSVLSGAREFIMRIGSNRFKTVDGVQSPNLDGDNGTDYKTKEIYNTLTPEQKTAYDAKYINTYVNVKNSIFKDNGLFAIGMDSHFAGAALQSGETVVGMFPQLEGLLTGWYDLSKTSYGAKLSFEGEVELYNWKLIDDVDSSSLIEVKGNYSIFQRMIFDVKGMITELSKDSRFSNIITHYNGRSMAHAGIVFFGGGKNYNVFEAKNGTTLYPYSISFDDIQRPELTFAAGNEPFYFFLYDKTSSFSPKVQEDKLKTGEAYECIYKK